MNYINVLEKSEKYFIKVGKQIIEVKYQFNRLGDIWLYTSKNEKILNNGCCGKQYKLFSNPQDCIFNKNELKSTQIPIKEFLQMYGFCVNGNYCICYDNSNGIVEEKPIFAYLIDVWFEDNEWHFKAPNGWYLRKEDAINDMIFEVITF